MNFLSVTFCYFDGRIFVNFPPPIDLADSNAPVKICKRTECIVFKKMWRCIRIQLSCKHFPRSMAVINSFLKYPRILSSCSSFILYVGGFLEEIATISKTSLVNCGLRPFLIDESNSVSNFTHGFSESS